MRKKLCGLGRWLLTYLRRLISRCDQRLVRQYGDQITSHAGTMLSLAYRARNRAIKRCAEEAAAAKDGVLADDTITAVVLAAAAAEGFVNELADNIGFIKQNAFYWNLDAKVHAACDAILDVEFRKESVAEKYLNAAKALKSPFDKGSLPFQEFKRLITLRNSIMHIKPVTLHPDTLKKEHRGEEVTDQLACRGIALSNKKSSLSWFDRLMTPEVARWACKTARAMILDLLNKVPVGTPDAFSELRTLYANDARFDSEDYV